ncbi:Rrf2 family transcriptional regulator [Clostridia bacterium]|nr:Rrf2 family transcriptional regulator [Clostridia bacterium]
MRISAKGRYALAAVTVIASRQQSGANTTVGSVSEELGLSKIYLEQVFAQLKKAGILVSVKGPKGGYSLARSASKITAWDVLSVLEISFAEQAEEATGTNDAGMEIALKQLVFDAVDKALKDTLSQVTAADLADGTERQRAEQSYMMGL